MSKDNKRVTGMDKFWSVFANYKRLLMAAVIESVLPFVAKFSNFAPPTSGIAPITALLMILVTIVVFQFNEKSTRKKTNSMILRSAGCVLVSLAMYFFLNVKFIFSYDGGRMFLGCGWTRNVKIVAKEFFVSIENQCPGDYSKLLNNFGGKITDVFISENIAYVEMAIVVVWVAFLLSVSATIALFVTYQHGRTVRV